MLTLPFYFRLPVTVFRGMITGVCKVCAPDQGSKDLEMKLVFNLFCLSAALVLALVISASGQGSGATATPQRKSTAGPSTFTIRQHSLQMKGSTLDRDVKVVRDCIARASRNLFDSSGNLNRTAQVDLEQCSRRLAQLRRKIASLGRESARLAFEVNAQQILLQSLQNQLTQSLGGQ